MIDTNKYYAKLANKESIGEDEIVALLREIEHFRGAFSYLASCEAATLEGLPKSCSKRERERHVGLCQTAAAVLVGDGSRISYPEGCGEAQDRMIHAYCRGWVGYLSGKTKSG